MKQIPCFDFKNYRDYLKNRFPVSGDTRGLRSRLAEELRVQPAFISRVLHNDAHFSLEHAVVINRFLNHTERESEYFLLLLQKDRAGSKELEDYLQQKMEKILEERQIIAERIQVKETLTAEDQMTYYSSWHYSAIHVMLMVSRWRTSQSISDYLKIPMQQTKKILEFLCSVGLAEERDGEFICGRNRIHLEKHSPILPRHHSNWRMRAMQSMDRNLAEDLYFSGPICLSETDGKKLREMLLKFLEESEKIIGPSPEETVFCLGIDFFRL